MPLSTIPLLCRTTFRKCILPLPPFLQIPVLTLSYSWTVASLDNTALYSIQGLNVYGVGLDVWGEFGPNHQDIVWVYDLIGDANLFNGNVPVEVETVFYSNSSDINTFLDFDYEGKYVVMFARIPYPEKEGAYGGGM